MLVLVPEQNLKESVKSCQTLFGIYVFCISILFWVLLLINKT